MFGMVLNTPLYVEVIRHVKIFSSPRVYLYNPQKTNLRTFIEKGILIQEVWPETVNQ